MLDENRIKLEFIAAVSTILINNALPELLDLIDEWRDETNEPPTAEEIQNLVNIIKKPMEYFED
jgi:hypothetical protein